jgi:hypothetical protein
MAIYTIALRRRQSEEACVPPYLPLSLHMRRSQITFTSNLLLTVVVYKNILIAERKFAAFMIAT